MLSLPNSTPSSTDPIMQKNVIHIDEVYDTVMLLLGLGTQRNIPDTYYWSDYEPVLKLCDKFGFEVIADRIEKRLYKLAEGYPANVLIYASGHDMVDLGRKAIAQLGSQYDMNDPDDLVEFIRQLSPTFAFALAQPLYGTVCISSNWEVVARSFDPL